MLMIKLFLLGIFSPKIIISEKNILSTIFCKQMLPNPSLAWIFSLFILCKLMYCWEEWFFLPLQLTPFSPFFLLPLPTHLNLQWQRPLFLLRLSNQLPAHLTYSSSLNSFLLWFLRPLPLSPNPKIPPFITFTPLVHHWQHVRAFCHTLKWLSQSKHSKIWKR
jgi:hypothetical protein